MRPRYALWQVIVKVPNMVRRAEFVRHISYASSKASGIGLQQIPDTCDL